MKEKLLKLARHSFVYAIGNALGTVGAFLLIPLYTHVLSTEEYGVLELLNRTADILMLLMILGVRQAFIRFYFDHDDVEWRKTVVSTTVFTILTSSITIAVIFFPFKGIVADILFKDSATGTLFIFILLWLPLNILVRVGMTHLQIQMKSIKYVTINLISLLLFISSNILLVYVLQFGIKGVLITNIFVAAIIGLSFFFSLVKWSRFKISIQLIKDLLKFGLPYLPTTIFGFMLMNSDRYFLSIFSSLDNVGIYSLSYKIGFLGLCFIMDSFGKIWSPFLFENYNKKDGPILISKVFTLYALICITVGLVISICSPIIIPLISAESFHTAYKIVPILCLASTFYGMANLADAGILISKKTHYKPLVFGISSLIALTTNFAFIPKFGAAGAATALVFSYLSLLVINHAVSNKFYVIRIELKKILMILTAATAVYLSSIYISAAGSHLPLINIFSILSFFLFPAILWFGGLFSTQEKRIVIDFITKFRMRTRGAAESKI